MRRLMTIFLLLVAIFLAYLIVANINDWWPWEEDDSEISGDTPTPTASPTPELFGRRVTDTALLYRVSVPTDWILTDNEGKDELQESYLQYDSPDFKLRTSGSRTYYERGARLMIHVVDGNFPQTHETEGGVSNAGIISNQSRLVAGISSSYHRFIHPTTNEGELLDTHIIRGGRTYMLTFAYNPIDFPSGRNLFDNIIKSFEIL